MKKKLSKKKKTAAIVAAVALALMFFIISPLFPYAVSLSVMSVYSHIHEADSIMANKGIELAIPGGGETSEDDWYPFVMTFNPGEVFGRTVGDRNLELTILYNFGAFDLRRGCSRLYDRDSDYYNSFYGAYLVTRQDGPEEEALFGFNEDGTMNADEAALVPKFDLQQLVLRDFGISHSEQVFEWTEEDAAENVEYLGYEGWSRVDASLLVSGASHVKDGFRRSYLQYGSPGYDISEDDAFKPVSMRGRIYGRYFEEWDTSVFFYILTPGKETLERCDREILSKSRLE